MKSTEKLFVLHVRPNYISLVNTSCDICTSGTATIASGVHSMKYFSVLYWKKYPLYICTEKNIAIFMI